MVLSFSDIFAQEYKDFFTSNVPTHIYFFKTCHAVRQKLTFAKKTIKLVGFASRSPRFRLCSAKIPQKTKIRLFCRLDFCGETSRQIERDRKCFNIFQTNGLLVKEILNASECIFQNNSIFAFDFDTTVVPKT